MSWRERDHEQQDNAGRGALGPLVALFTGSVPLGTWFAIRVRAHATLIAFILLTLLFSPASGEHFRFTAALISMAILFAIVLLHEFGHCLAARAVGGWADDILLWPLGGLAFTHAPHRPVAQFITVIGGPLVNVAICLLTAATLWLLTGRLVPLNPFHPLPPAEFGLTHAAYYLWWVFSISYILLLFNLLPIFPLDGGQALQTILWPRIGYYRSIHAACLIGMAGAIFLTLAGFVGGVNFLLITLGLCLFAYCYQRRLVLKDLGPEGLEESLVLAESAHPSPRPRHHRRLSRRFIRKIQRRAENEQREQARIDAILEKVSHFGLKSLNWLERRALHKATARQRQQDVELKAEYRHA
jgi:Zn-dependent protease